MYAPRRLFLDDIRNNLVKRNEYFLNAIQIMHNEQKILQSAYHEERKMIQKERESSTDKRYSLATGEKCAWISRVVIRIKELKITNRKELKSFNSGSYYQLRFERYVGNRRSEYIPWRKDSKEYTTNGLCNDSRNRVTLEEKDSLIFYMDEVNLYNENMRVLRDLFIQHLKVIRSFENIF